MTVYETPNEPMGPVYDAQGNKWRKDENDEYWLKTTDASSLTWGTLVCVYGPLSDTPNFKVGKTVDVDELWALPVGSVVLVDNYGAYTRFDFGYVRVSVGGNDTMTFNHNTKFDGKITVVRIGWRS